MRLKLDEIKLDEMNKNQKLAMFVVICCIGLFIIGIIGNIISPDQNTNTTTSDNSHSFDTTPQEKHYTPNITDNFTYMGEDINVVSEEYQFGLTDNEGRYCRFDWHTANKIGQVDSNTRIVYDFDMNKSDGVLGSLDYEGTTIGSSGVNHIFSHTNNENKVQFSYECKNGNFSFTTEQKDIGPLKNQTVIVNVYYPNGTEIHEN